MAVNVERAPQIRPRWPSDAADPGQVHLKYDPPADELTLYFAGRPRGGVCDPINEPGGETLPSSSTRRRTRSSASR